MLSKELLQKLVKTMFCGLFLVVAYILLRSLGGPSRITSTADTSNKSLYDDVVIGQTAARRQGSTRVWVTRLSEAHKRQARDLNQYLVDPDAGCAIDADLCVIEAKTDRSGIDITFTAVAPRSVTSDIPWFGGYVDPTTGEIFDRLGRAYTVTHKARVALPILSKP